MQFFAVELQTANHIHHHQVAVPKTKTDLFLVHGVNSELQWSPPAVETLKHDFECHEIIYRHFHSLWGPIKVYFWPSAFLTLICFVLFWFGAADNGLNVARFLLLLLLLGQAGVVLWAEYRWGERIKGDRNLGIPLSLTIVGIVAWVWCIFLEPGSSPKRSVLPGAVLISLSFFLDVREYSSIPTTRKELKLNPARLGFSTVLLTCVAWVLTLVFIDGVVSQTGILVVTIVVGILEPFYRTHRAIKKVRAEIETKSNYARPFVVCHSLGTYLVGNILREFESVRLGRLILTGCVLPCWFPWDKNCGSDSGVMEVTNYVGYRDFVPMLTSLLALPARAIGWCVSLVLSASLIEIFRCALFWRSLGGAGIFGFNYCPETVHDLEKNGQCGDCEKRDAPVHNVRVRRAGHSTINRSKEFHQYNWLPQLWGWNGVEFRLWLETCEFGWQCSQPNADGSLSNDAGMAAMESIIRGEHGKWSWAIYPQKYDRTPPRMLHEYADPILDRLKVSGDLRNEILRLLPRYIFVLVGPARRELRNESVSSPDVVENLHPQVALKKAILLAYGELSKGEAHDS